MCFQLLIFTLDFDDDAVQAGVAGEDASEHGMIVYEYGEWGGGIEGVM